MLGDALLKQAPWMNAEILGPAEQHSLVLMTVDNNKAVGYLRAITDEHTITYICDLIVDETHRNKGIGTGLMRQLLSHPWVKDSTIVLLTAGAEEFYRKFGFTERTAMVRRPQ